ncbi:MAG: metalloregulator ArsR/SmtB family transcription factor [Peptococcia bacterium]
MERASQYIITEREKELLTDYAEILKALSHPIRLCIVKKLCLYGECNVTCIQNSLNMPQSTVSQHLSKLKALGIVDGKRQGTEIIYNVVNPKAKLIVDTLMNK